MPEKPTFEQLVAEGESIPTEGWDFSWFAGRATEERPSWGYARLVAERLAHAHAALDLQTGGGEVYAESLANASGRPATIVATEAWPPNVPLARARLARFGGTVRHLDEHADLPFADASFDLITSRHPISIRWDEVARVLAAGGTYLSQDVGAGSVHELTDFMMGTQEIKDYRNPKRAVAAALFHGLDVVDVRAESLRMEFIDIAAVVHFLRKVIWIVPGFTVSGYRDRLAELHRLIERNGPFVAHAERFLIEVTKPVG